MDFVTDISKSGKPPLPLPMPFLKMLATAAAVLPEPYLTADEVDLWSQDNVLDPDTFAAVRRAAASTPFARRTTPRRQGEAVSSHTLASRPEWRVVLDAVRDPTLLARVLAATGMQLQLVPRTDENHVSVLRYSRRGDGIDAHHDGNVYRKKVGPLDGYGFVKDYDCSREVLREYYDLCYDGRDHCHDSVRDLKGQQARAPKAKEQSRSLAKLIGKPSLTDEPETRTAHATLAKLSTIPAKQRAVMHTDDLLRIATEILTPLVKERVAREDARRGFAPRK